MRRIKGFYRFLIVVIKEFNEVMLQKAETIRCQRQISLLNEEFNLPDNTKRNADALK